MVGDPRLAHAEQRAVVGIAVVRQQPHLRIGAGRRGSERLAGHVGLLDGALVVQERGEVEGVGPDHVVGEAVFGLQPRPEQFLRERRDHHRMPLHLGERLVARRLVGHQDLLVLLHDRGDHGDRDGVLGEPDRLHARGDQRHIHRTRHQHLRPVHLRPAGHDGHVQPVPGVDAHRARVVVAAMLGLGRPVGDEFQFVGRAGGGCGEHGADGGGGERGAHQQVIEARHVLSRQAVAAVAFAFRANTLILRHGHAGDNAWAAPAVNRLGCPRRVVSGPGA